MMHTKKLSARVDVVKSDQLISLEQGLSDIETLEQRVGTKRQSVSSNDAGQVEEILGTKPAFSLEDGNKVTTAPAYIGKTYWYFDAFGCLLGRASVFNYADGRVEVVWWNRFGRRPMIFDAFAFPPSFLPH